MVKQLKVMEKNRSLIMPYRCLWIACLRQAESFRMVIQMKNQQTISIYQSGLFAWKKETLYKQRTQRIRKNIQQKKLNIWKKAHFVTYYSEDGRGKCLPTEQKFIESILQIFKFAFVLNQMEIETGWKKK